MWSTGMVRPLDRLGRVVIPKPVRDALGITEGTAVEIYVEGDRIVLERYLPRCVFCGEPADAEFKARRLCGACASALRVRAEAAAARGVGYERHKLRRRAKRDPSARPARTATGASP